MQNLSIQYEPPSHGWLPLQIRVDGRGVSMDSSDVPNNPIQELIEALGQAAAGSESCVWWNLEPDGYFMRFIPVGNEIEFRLEFSPNSERGRSQVVLSVQDARPKVLLPFWRFLRDFQARSFAEPHWPPVSYERIFAIKEAIGGANEI
jgi:hypothetical protein